VTVVIRVTGKRHVKAFFQADQALHGVAGRRVHADPAIPVHAHKAERRVDRGVHHVQIKAVVFADRRPVAHTCATQRIYAQAQIGAAQGVHVDHVFQIGNIGIQVIMTMGSAGFKGLLVAYALDPGQPGREQFIGLGFNPLGDIGISRAAIGRVVLETAAFWRIV